MKLEKVVKSDAKGRKFTAYFCMCEGESKCSKKKKVHFGQEFAADYTITKDKEQRDRYRARTKSVYNKAPPTSASRLAGDLLWGDSTSLQQNIKDYKKKYNL